MAYDVVPSMRCKGPDFLLSTTADISSPPQRRVLFRYLANHERFNLQGHCSDAHEFMKSGNHARYATGNPYSVPMAASMTIPMIQSIVSGPSMKAKLGQRLSTREID